ncbi:hypothetical protein ES703_02962 [subsurface metagenome]
MSKERLSKLQIDPEFQSLIPALTKEELSLLEESLKHEGCRDPLVIWKGKILDGHHRYGICRTHGIEFKTREAKIADRTEAKVWIIKNQFARRNLILFDRCELALKLKPLIAMQAKKHQRLSKGRGKKGLLKKINLIDTEKELARIAGASKATINKAGYILDHGNEDEINRAKKGKQSVHKIKSEVKTRTYREGVDKKWAEVEEEWYGTSVPVENEPGTRIKYYTDKWGNERYKTETRKEWGGEEDGWTGGVIKYNPEYLKIKNGEATSLTGISLISKLRSKIYAIEEADKVIKWLLKNAQILKEAYEFDGYADNLESAKKYLWPKIIEPSKKLIRTLSKLEAEITPTVRQEGIDKALEQIESGTGPELPRNRHERPQGA